MSGKTIQTLSRCYSAPNILNHPSSKSKKTRNTKNLSVLVPTKSPSLPLNTSKLDANSSGVHNFHPPPVLSKSPSIYSDSSSDNSTIPSPYKDQPIRILPNLYLGDEHNATDIETLSKLKVKYILNVAKEVEDPFESKLFHPSDISLVSPHQHFLQSVQTIYPTSKYQKSISSPKVLLPLNESTNTSTYTFQLSPSLLSKQHTHQISYKKLNWAHNQDNLIEYFDSAFSFIDEAREQDFGVLVHCQCGISRSASLIIAYVMKTLQLSLDDAYHLVKSQSSQISPNLGLIYQLMEFEKTLKRHSDRAKSCIFPFSTLPSSNSPPTLTESPTSTLSSPFITSFACS